MRSAKMAPSDMSCLGLILKAVKFLVLNSLVLKNCSMIFFGVRPAVCQNVGRIGIFNRSYYEEVLVVRVHPEILLKQGSSEELHDDKNIWEERYRSIVDLEEHLYRNSTRIIKFFLHLSEEEQRKRFLARIDEPDKNWKFSLSDIQERKYWTEYVKAYEECLNATSTHHAPWYVVPADDKENARLIVSQIILDASMNLRWLIPRSTRNTGRN